MSYGLERRIANFIRKATELHESKFDYTNIEYKNTNTKVCIVCPTHGEFWQTPRSHLQGNGCSMCSKKKKHTTTSFIAEARKIHGFCYDYSNVQYTNAHTKVEIICPLHGSFMQTPTTHLSYSGCVVCGLRSTHVYAWRYRDFVKVGVTISNGLNRRIGAVCHPRGWDVGEVEILFLIPDINPNNIEKNIHKELHRFKYTGNCTAEGYTELFSKVDNKTVMGALNKSRD